LSVLPPVLLYPSTVRMAQVESPGPIGALSATATPGSATLTAMRPSTSRVRIQPSLVSLCHSTLPDGVRPGKGSERDLDLEFSRGRRAALEKRHSGHHEVCSRCEPDWGRPVSTWVANLQGRTEAQYPRKYCCNS